MRELYSASMAVYDYTDAWNFASYWIVRWPTHCHRKTSNILRKTNSTSSLSQFFHTNNISVIHTWIDCLRRTVQSRNQLQSDSMTLQRLLGNRPSVVWRRGQRYCSMQIPSHDCSKTFGTWRGIYIIIMNATYFNKHRIYIWGFRQKSANGLNYSYKKQHSIGYEDLLVKKPGNSCCLFFP